MLPLNNSVKSAGSLCSLIKCYKNISKGSFCFILNIIELLFYKYIPLQGGDNPQPAFSLPRLDTFQNRSFGKICHLPLLPATSKPRQMALFLGDKINKMIYKNYFY